MTSFLSVFTSNREEQKRRWVFHLSARNVLRYIFRVNEKSTTLSDGKNTPAKYRLRPQSSTTATARRPLIFVFEQLDRVLLWSKRLLTITIYSASNISAQLCVAGILLKELQEEPFEVVLRGKPRTNLLLVSESELSVLKHEHLIDGIPVRAVKESNRFIVDFFEVGKIVLPYNVQGKWVDMPTDIFEELPVHVT